MGTPPWRDRAVVRRAVVGWVVEALAVGDPERAPVWVARAGGRARAFYERLGYVTRRSCSPVR